MARSQNIKYFGERLTAIIMQSSNAFDGTTDQANDPTLSPGVYTFAPQAGGGMFNFHEEAVTVKSIDFKGGGTIAVTKVLTTAGNAEVPVATLSPGTYTTPIDLAPGEYLKCVGGSGTPILVFNSKLANVPGLGW